MSSIPGMNSNVSSTRSRTPTSQAQAVPGRETQSDSSLRDIKHYTKSCQSLFEEAQGHQILSEAEWLDRLAARFHWWSLCTGASKCGNSSLDCRVLCYDVAFEVNILDQTKALTMSLQNCIATATEAETKELQDSTVDSRFQEQRNHMEMILKLLYKFSARVMNSKTNAPHKNVDALLDKRPVELEEFRNYVFRLLPLTESGVSRPIKARLLRANLTRRNRFDIYLKRCLHESPDSDELAQLFYPLAQKDESRSDSATKSSGTKMLQRHDPKKGYPKYPPVSNAPFRCPYCAQLLDPLYSDPRNSKKWRAHLVEDLSPYVCVYAQCGQPDVMYTTADEWRKHLRGHHSETHWLCDTCWLDSDNPSAFEFPKEEDYRLHLDSDHHGEFNVEDLPLIIELSRRTLVPAVRCPLCPGTAPLLHPETDKHITEHLHSFALKAMFWKPILHPDLPKTEYTALGSVAKSIPAAFGPIKRSPMDLAEPNPDLLRRFMGRSGRFISESQPSGRVSGIETRVLDSTNASANAEDPLERETEAQLSRDEDPNI